MTTGINWRMTMNKLLGRWKKRAQNYINFAELNMGKQAPNITVYECYQMANALAGTILALEKSLKALEFYADEQKWENVSSSDMFVPNSFDSGKNNYGYEVAQQALKEFEENWGDQDYE